jgi:PAS domain S-box-containing protein
MAACPGAKGLVAAQELDALSRFSPLGAQERPPPPAASPGPPGRVPSMDLLWSDFLENGPTGLHLADGAGRILWANHAEAAILGYTREELVGRDLAELHVDPQSLQAIVTRLRSGLPVVDHPARLRAKDGSIRLVRIQATARIEDGRIVQVRGGTRDVTDREKLEQARHAAAQLLDAMVDGFMHIGRDWRITYSNPMGGDPTMKQRMEGRNLFEIHPQVLGTVFEDRYREAMAGRRTFFEAYYPASGAWFENTLLPVDDGVWLYYRDVTDRHRTEDLLHLRNRQQAAIARLGQVAISSGDVDTLLHAVCQEATRALDVEFCKVLKLQPNGTLLLRAGIGWRPGLVGTAVLPSGQGSLGSYTLQAHEPVIVKELGRDARFQATPLLQEHGVVSGMSVLIGGPNAPYGVLGAHTASRRDFTEDDIHFLQAIAHLLASAMERIQVDRELRRHRDHLEDLVRERTHLLEESNKELEAFSYSVSHDLRTPLRAMGGFSDLLLRRHADKLDPQVQELLGFIHAGALRMGQLIEDLLDLSRFHRIEIVRQDIDVSALARDLVSELRARAPRQVEVLVEPGLRARGDPKLLRVALDNLLANAWKFTQATPAARIEVGSEPAAEPGGPPVLFVRDNGAGFDAAFVDQLFRPFHRLHKDEEFEGNGIGLATVARIVQRHGGKVWADGTPGKGATFRLTLP